MLTRPGAKWIVSTAPNIAKPPNISNDGMGVTSQYDIHPLIIYSPRACLGVEAISLDWLGRPPGVLSPYD